MKEIIAPEGPIMQFFAKILDMVIVSILFTVTCIPVITIGCALTSLYYTVTKSIYRGEGGTVRSYCHCFQVNFKQGLGLGILCDIVAAIMIGNLYLVATMDLGNVGVLFGAIFLVICLLLLVLMSYGFPLLSRFEVKLGGLLLSSFQISVLHGSVTFQLVVMEAMLLAGMLFAFITFPPLVILLPGLLGYGQAKVLEPVLQTYMQERVDRSEK
ncbi:MAG: YesL family protein [Lachnospiraceae bacterium]|nr:YesL family protein [Lachnospiraceae bacterium]